MTPSDFRAVCTAISFATIVANPQKLSKKNVGLHVAGFAKLIEKFCRDAVPDAFGSTNDNQNASRELSKVDKIIDRIKRDLNNKRKIKLPPGEATLRLIYTRLRQRQLEQTPNKLSKKVGKNVLANCIRKMIDEEIDSERG